MGVLIDFGFGEMCFYCKAVARDRWTRVNLNAYNKEICC